MSVGGFGFGFGFFMELWLISGLGGFLEKDMNVLK